MSEAAGRGERRLALFDLDNTLLTGDSDEEWLDWLIERGVYQRGPAEAANRDIMARYADGSVGTLEFVEFFLRTLADRPLEQLLGWRAEYIEQRIVPRVRALGRACIERHRECGDLVVIVTATNRFITEPIAALLGVEHLIATEAEMRDGRYTGKAEGTPSFRDGKVTRLDAWLGARGERLANFVESWFYSDSANDLPLLARVTHPVAVDPAPALAAEARRRGWPVLSFA